MKKERVSVKGHTLLIFAMTGLDEKSSAKRRMASAFFQVVPQLLDLGEKAVAFR